MVFLNMFETLKSFPFSTTLGKIRNQPSISNSYTWCNEIIAFTIPLMFKKIKHSK